MGLLRATDTPPGYYMLFILSSQGVPSVGKIVRISVAANPNPTPDTTQVIGGTGGSPFTLACNANEVLAGIYGTSAGTHVNQAGLQMHPDRPERALDRHSSQSRNHWCGERHELYEDLPDELCHQRLSWAFEYVRRSARLRMSRADLSGQDHRRRTVSRPSRRYRRNRHKDLTTAAPTIPPTP